MNEQSQWPIQLAAGVKKMGLEVSASQQQKMLDYLALLVKWNQAFNLTAIRDLGQMVSRQLLDSLSILSLVKGQRVLDVGTGAGLPGIPLSIMYPAKQFVLLDSNGKKTRFVQQAKMTLGLDNLEVVQSRVDEYQPAKLFDCITSRAFADLPDMIKGTQHLLSEQGFLLAMKGLIPTEEMQSIEQKGWMVTVELLTLPNNTSQRHAIICTKNNA